jgi:hypothetical protein
MKIKIGQKENYLKMSSIITNNPYPFAEIEEETERFGCLYIPIPQNIHIQNILIQNNYEVIENKFGYELNVYDEMKESLRRSNYEYFFVKKI